MKELKTISDEKLLRQIQSGNDDAMECLLERYRDMVRKEARSFFLAGGDEEDLIQEGNMALWMALGALPELGSAPEVDKYLEGQVIAGFEAHIREVTEIPTRCRRYLEKQHCCMRHANIWQKKMHKIRPSGN